MVMDIPCVDVVVVSVCLEVSMITNVLAYMNVTHVVPLLLVLLRVSFVWLPLLPWSGFYAVYLRFCLCEKCKTSTSTGIYVSRAFYIYSIYVSHTYIYI